MHRTFSALAASAIALSAAALTATEASARGTPEPRTESTTTPDCHWSYHPVCKEPPIPVPRAETLAPSPSDDDGADSRQTTASTLGTAALAFAALWLYRRHHAPNI